MPTADDLSESDLPVDRTEEVVRVLSGLQTHLLPDGNVEFGVVCVVVGSQYFGNDLGFLTLIRADNLPEIGEEVPVYYYANFWAVLRGEFPGAGNRRFAPRP